jgi:hypothetical protein
LLTLFNLHNLFTVAYTLISTAFQTVRQNGKQHICEVFKELEKEKCHFIVILEINVFSIGQESTLYCSLFREVLRAIAMETGTKV